MRRKQRLYFAIKIIIINFYILIDLIAIYIFLTSFSIYFYIYLRFKAL